MEDFLVIFDQVTAAREELERTRALSENVEIRMRNLLKIYAAGRETTPVSVSDPADNEKIEIRVRTMSSDGCYIALILSKPQRSLSVAVLQIPNYGGRATNWQNKWPTLAELEMASNILSFLEQHFEGTENVSPHLLKEQELLTRDSFISY